MGRQPSKPLVACVHACARSSYTNCVRAIQMKPEPNKGSCDVDQGIRDTDTAASPKKEHSLLKTAGSALFYGTTSFLLTVVCKVLLTKYDFPPAAVIGLGQVTTAVIILYAAHLCGFISLRSLDSLTVDKMWPLPLVYLSNVLLSLSSTKKLSLPMFTVLRQLACLITMLGEMYLFGTYPTLTVQLSVYSMVLGATIAAIAASNDLTFCAESYLLVMLNNLSTASYVLIMKNKLDIAYVGEHRLLYYNSIITIPFLTVLCCLQGDFRTIMVFSRWSDPLFIAYFVLCCVLGLFLNYSMILCTEYNSPLTTTVVGCIKNISITYLGTIIGGDYVFSLINFLGINVGVAGSLLYSWVTFSQKQPTRTQINSV